MKLTLPRVFLALAFTSVLAIPASSQASPIAGKLTINGDSTIGIGSVTFLCDIIVLGSQPCPAGFGNFLAGGPLAQSGSFAPYANDPGFLESLNFTVRPLNAAFSLPNFLTFSPTGTVLSPDIALDLTFIHLGTEGLGQCGAPPNPSQIPAQVCTPQLASFVTASNPSGISPFNFANTATGSTASFTVSGNARRISTGELSPFDGSFGATFTSNPNTTNGSYQAILAQLAASGSISTGDTMTFQADFGQPPPPPPVPEPASLTLLATGLAGAVFRRVRARKELK